MANKSTCGFSVIVAGAAALLLAADPVAAQQFQEMQSTRFPQPPPTEYTSQLTVGDLDGDGDLDIAWANGNGFFCPVTPEVLRVFINDGLAVFTDESVARTGGLSFRARGVELGDIECDGDLDIIVAQDCANLPALLVNNGSGFFTNEAATRLPNLPLGSARGQFGDVDNDGDLDLYLTDGGASRWGAARGKLYLNDGAGFYTDATAANTPNETVSEPQDCIFGDIDGDFDLDLRIGSTASSQSKLYRNNGAGVFSRVVAPANPPDANCYSYDFGDINGDGDLDLLGANASPTSVNAEFLLSNDGAGTFANVSDQISPNPTVDDNDTKFFDYDNDGDLDYVIGRLGGAERIYNNNGAGVFTQIAGLITSITDGTLDVKVADFNGDGRLDIVTAQGESSNLTHRINRIYMNVSGPADTRPPTVVRTEQLADGSGQAMAVRTIIYDSHTSDRGFHDKGITLNWRNVGLLAEKAGGGPFTETPMRWSGNSLWRGVIPAQSSSGVIEYFITARDFNNNLGTGPTLTVTVLLPCPADIAGADRVVDVNDLLTLIGAWGPGGGGGPADITPPPAGDGTVDVNDLLALIGAWGECP